VCLKSVVSEIMYVIPKTREEGGKGVNLIVSEA
jgi:hypothetical protein